MPVVLITCVCRVKGGASEKDLYLPSASLIEYSFGLSPQNSAIGRLPISSLNLRVTRALSLLYSGCSGGKFEKSNCSATCFFFCISAKKSLERTSYTKESVSE